MKKAAKLILKIVLLILALFFILVISLQVPFVQNIVKNKVVSYLENQIKTKVEIGSIEISLPKKMSLNDFYFEDQSHDTLLEGKSLKVDVGLFALFNNSVEINSITLEETTLNIRVNKDSISNFDYIIKAFETPDKSKSSDKSWQLSIGKINLSNIKFSYKDQIAHLNTGIKFSKLEAKLKAIDLEKQTLSIRSLDLSHTEGYLTFNKSDKIKKPKLEVKEGGSNLPWEITADNVNINTFNFVFDDNNALILSKGIDYNHLKINDLNLNAESLAIHGDKYSGTIKSFNLKEKSGLVLEEFITNFNYTPTGAYLKNLYLQTPQTVLQKNISMTYPSIGSLSKSPQTLYIDTDFENSKIGFKDVLLFVPSLDANDVFRNHPNAIVNINADIKGKLDDLKIKTFTANGLGETTINAEGTIAGLPNMEKSIFDIKIIDLESTSKDIYSFTPKNTIPNTVQLPEKLNLIGHFKGSINAFETDFILKSTLGNATVKATYNQTIKNNVTYIADARIENFDLGTFIKNNQFGKVTANAHIKGRNLDPNTATATLSSKILNATFNNYTYSNINVNGSIDNGVFVANATSNDPNLTFIIDAEGASNSHKPTLDLSLNLEIVDLNKLNFHTEPLKMKGQINANFTDLNPDNLNGTVNVNNFLVALEKEQFPLDTISIRAISTKEKDSIVLKSQFATGLITGNYELSTISDQLINSISKYYQFDKKYVNNNADQDLQFDFTIKDNPIIKKMVPEIKELSEIKISGKYNSINDTIIINASIPRLNYADIEISNSILNINTQENALLYDVSIANIKNDELIVPQTRIVGKIEDNTIDYELNIKDSEGKERYNISGNFKENNGTSEIYFNPEALLLNYENWTIEENNLIEIEKNGILVNNFKIQNNQQVFAIQSENPSVISPIAVDFENFKLETLTSIVSSNFEVGGNVNGKTTIENITVNPLFVADLNVENFTFKKDTVGNLSLKIDNKTNNIYNANVALTDDKNQLNIDGNYNISSKNLDFIVDIKKLEMASIEVFTFDNLKEGEGYLTGKLEVTGNASSPDVNGAIQFNSVGFTVVKLNSRFQLINDAIIFKNDRLVFEDFKLEDEDNNPLTIDGYINSEDYTNLEFDLNVVANNFKAMNSKASDNKLFYGELYLDNNLDVTGTLNNPVVNGTVKINADTKFTIVLPQSDPSIADREGIVEFIDQDQPILIAYEEDVTKNLTQTEVKGMNGSVNIEIDKKAEISIIIDEANGDYLKLQGEAELTGGIDPSGKMTLTGKYEFTGGAYEMNFNLIKRKFDIQPGSYILWTGEPTTANISITAVYNVEASPIDLVNDQLTGISAETRNTYKQKIPFETNLIMKGELMQPEITFDIILPEGNNDVSTEIINATQTKLQQIRRDEDALNKQVFALLLLNRFIGENPFESQSGGTSGVFIAKQSASKILSQQLNNFAGNLIEGFEVDFDLEATENYSSGNREERTDLNVGLTKQLLNDRLKVTVGSSFGIEGSQQENEQTTNIAGDIQVDYLITKDGRYKLRAYRKNKYQVALVGQVIETGVAFIITMNYDKFKELFQKKSEAGKKTRK